MNFENRYSWIDRLLHRMAFSSGGLQIALADIEEKLYQSQLSAVSIEKPVFITALPRAGTTILLNILAASGSFATHTYRDMPFILCPLFWNRFSRNFQVKSEERERAHGDGLSVSADSPEAFEEIIWKYYWPTHYKSEYISPWTACDNQEFMDFFKSHIKKIILLKRQSSDHSPRYISKNNLNISRLACLPDVFPGAQIFVLFREPYQHAFSLLKQHHNFLMAHKDDEFIKDYMKGIGHFDFGDNFRPVNFDFWLDKARYPDKLNINFWLEYWIATYRNLLLHANQTVQLLSYQNLTVYSQMGLEKIADVLEMENPVWLIEQADTLTSPKKYDINANSLDSQLMTIATELYHELERNALNNLES